MSRLVLAILLSATIASAQEGRRIVIVKVDGLNADLLFRDMSQIDPATGKSRLPWMQHIFRENGTVFEDFYSRGISLSAPSWSMLDTGHHTVIRANVEYDRYSGEVFDYLNFFPFYIGYARLHEVDMPGVEVLDRAGIPLIIDAYRYPDVYQSFQLFQRGVRWTTLANVLKRRFSSEVLLSTVENAESPSLGALYQHEAENEIGAGLRNARVMYLDLYTGDVDHEGHATNRPAALLSVLKELDTAVGRIWSGIQASPSAANTVMVMVSDHGMNNDPDVLSQVFSLPDLFNSPQGGAHHVITNRHQLERFKLMGLDPLVNRVITPSTESFYLAGEASRYPTAWLDLDGNERASVQLRNSDLNKIHILLQQLSRDNLSPEIRDAAAVSLRETIERHRASWTRLSAEFTQELDALADDIRTRTPMVKKQHKRWTSAKTTAQDKANLRSSQQLSAWKHEKVAYKDYLEHVRKLLSLQVDDHRPFHGKISGLVPEMSLGDGNSVAELEHYLAGPMPGGLVVDSRGHLDEARSFRFVNYFALLSEQRVRNNPQAALSPRPVDFTVLRLPQGAVPDAANSYWVYGNEDSQLLILQNASGELAARPIKRLVQNEAGITSWTEQSWRDGLPLALFEDPLLKIPAGEDRGAWLSGWHPESEWLKAIHQCRYSNGVIGITEQFSPVGLNVAGTTGESPARLRYEKHRRELVEPDFQVFAADHWNFNVRDVNPGGNHGSFLRISTHSAWMMAGAGVPVKSVAEPYDSLNFASTILSIAGKTPPMPERVVLLR